MQSLQLAYLVLQAPSYNFLFSNTQLHTFLFQILSATGEGNLTADSKYPFLCHPPFFLLNISLQQH